MKSRFLAMLLLAGSSFFAVPGVVWASVVAYGPPPPARSHILPAPRPGYTWVPGYYHPLGRHWTWHSGYWARPPYPHARWVVPRYSRGRYYAGYWRR
jgi:WXXGXW repeat (2 copies)